MSCSTISRSHNFYLGSHFQANLEIVKNSKFLSKFPLKNSENIFQWIKIKIPLPRNCRPTRCGHFAVKIMTVRLNLAKKIENQ